jgi:hypothetical protein
MNIEKLQQIALKEYPDIIDIAVIRDENELRLILHDGSFIDIWFSLSRENKYSYHWERRLIDGTIYRHDNTPHLKWQYISTFPKHYHEKTESNVKESYINENPVLAIRELLNFVKKTI